MNTEPHDTDVPEDANIEKFCWTSRAEIMPLQQKNKSIYQSKYPLYVPLRHLAVHMDPGGPPKKEEGGYGLLGLTAELQCACFSKPSYVQSFSVAARFGEICVPNTVVVTVSR